MIAIALIERVGGGIKPPAEALDKHGIRFARGTTEDAAAAYAETMIAQFGSELPQFDLILLGMGPDGHTASLFPGQPEPTAPGDALVLAVHHAPKPPPDRVSFSYKLINAARTVLPVAMPSSTTITSRPATGTAARPAR